MFGLREILNFAKYYGPITPLKMGWRRFVYRNAERILAVRSLDEPIPDLQPSADVTVRRAVLDDAVKLRVLFAEAGEPRPGLRLEDWIRRKYPVLVAECEGQIVGYGAISLEVSLRDPLVSEAVRKVVEIRDDDAWGADAFVRPSYRGRRIYPALGTELLGLAKSAGVRRILGSILAENASSRAAHARLGCTEICEMKLWRVLCFKGVRIRMLKGGRENGELPRSS